MEIKLYHQRVDEFIEESFIRIREAIEKKRIEKQHLLKEDRVEFLKILLLQNVGSVYIDLLEDLNYLDTHEEVLINETNKLKLLIY